MKKEKISQSLNEMDMRFVEEADNFVVNKKARFSGKIKWLAAAACFALMVIISKPVLNYATGDSVNSYFEGETEPYMEEILSHVTSVSNEELELRVEGGIADEYLCYMIVSFVGLTDEMEARLLQGNLEEQDLFEQYVVLPNGERVPHITSGSNTHIVETVTGRRKAVSMIPDAHATYIISYRFDDNNLSEIEKVGFAFEGLAVEVDVNDYLSPMYRLEAENGEGALTDAYVSRISFGFTYHFDEPITDEDIENMNIEYDIRLIRADGTVLTDEEMGEDIGYSMSGGYGTGDMEECLDGRWMNGHMPEIINLEDYCGLQVNGVNYYFVTE